MRQTGLLLLASMASALCASCFGADHDRCGEGFTYENNSCMVAKRAEEPDGQQQNPGGEIDPEQWIGTACSCSADGDSVCDLMGVPLVNGGIISGCDSVPAVWTGAERACQRSYPGELSGATYYANGFCTLMAVDCTGNSLVCNPAMFGDYANMQSCPKNTVLLDYSIDVDVMGVQGTLYTKSCAPGCETDEDCRNTEDDPVLGDKTQYQCLDRDGVRFCQDPRNLGGDYTAEAF